MRRPSASAFQGLSVGRELPRCFSPHAAVAKNTRTSPRAKSSANSFSRLTGVSLRLAPRTHSPFSQASLPCTSTVFRRPFSMEEWKLPSTAGRPICVIGAGVLGRRIAACWASAGYKVHIRDPDSGQLAAAVQYVRDELWKYEPSVKADEVSVEGFEDLGPAVQDAWLVVECVPEKLELKIKVFAEIEQLAPRDAILATNSSSYKSREIAAHLRPDTAQRVLNTHYYIPPDIRAVELMTSGSTRADIFPFLQEHLRASGMRPVVAKRESTGFILNRVWAAVKRECLMVLAEGVASPEELDEVWAEMFVKARALPCETMDRVGLDTVSLIEQHYIAERGLHDPGVIAYLQKFIDEGKLGAKCSKGGLYPPEHYGKPAP